MSSTTERFSHTHMPAVVHKSQEPMQGIKTVVLFAGFRQHAASLAAPCDRRALPTATSTHPQSNSLHRPDVLPPQVRFGALCNGCDGSFQPLHDMLKSSRSQTTLCDGLLQQCAPCGKGQRHRHGPPGAASAIPTRPGHEGAHTTWHLLVLCFHYMFTACLYIYIYTSAAVYFSSARAA